MKILLDVKGLGLLAIIPHNYVVADGIGVIKEGDDKGKEYFKNERYFPDLPSALEEMRQCNQAKGLAKGSPARSIAELLTRVERISNNWVSIIKKSELSGLKRVLTPPTE